MRDWSSVTNATSPLLLRGALYPSEGTVDVADLNATNGVKEATRPRKGQQTRVALSGRLSVRVFGVRVLLI